MSIDYLLLIIGLCMVQSSLAIDANQRPIIGVLAEEIAWSLLDRYPEDLPHSYIAASYVKFVEGGGARPVPIWIGKSKEYYSDIMEKINGILLPGGGLWFNSTEGYSEAGGYIYDIAKELNNKGDYFPIWGTCLGFELLVYLSANNTELRADCRSNNQNLALEFEPNYRESRMFTSASDEIVKILASEGVTPNFHNYCVTKENLTAFGLDQEWNVISMNNDTTGVRFISSMEHTAFPFYGLQFHPEKTTYEWVESRNISHSVGAVYMSQYFASFFVNECRKSKHKFDNYTEELNHLIYNFPVTFSAQRGSLYEQSYMFKENVDYPNSASRLGGFFTFLTIAIVLGDNAWLIN